MATKSEIKNIGQLSFKNAKKVVLETVIPYDAREKFISAENQGDRSYPSCTRILGSYF